MVVALGERAEALDALVSVSCGLRNAVVRCATVLLITYPRVCDSFFSDACWDFESFDDLGSIEVQNISTPDPDD